MSEQKEATDRIDDRHEVGCPYRYGAVAPPMFNHAECPCHSDKNPFKQSAAISDQLAWDRFASAALQGVVASSHTEMGSYISAAHDAARYADAMMIERAQRLAGKTPSAEYIEVAREVQAWIVEQIKCRQARSRNEAQP